MNQPVPADGLQPNKLAEVLEQLDECSFPHWFEDFEKIAIRGVSVEIPENALEYLRDEIVVLPKECYPSENSVDNRNKVIDLTTLDALDADDKSEEDEIRQPEYPEFSKRITKAIAQLKGGVAFLKTNWHCPKDAFWITAGQTLQVKDITDVYQLLKASSIVKQDLNRHGLPDSIVDVPDSQLIHKTTDKHFIVLKEWHEIHPGTEFRCFVRRRSLIAISPRDWPAYHEDIVQQKRDICMDIRSIFRERIKDQFPLGSCKFENNLGVVLSIYAPFTVVFDVVRVAKDVVLLVDFSPFNELTTDPLAFDWIELNDERMFLEVNIQFNILTDSRTISFLAIHKFLISIPHSVFRYIFQNDDPEFRYLPNDCGIQPSKRNNYGIPIDIIDMFNGNSVDLGNFLRDGRHSDMCSSDALL